MRWPTVAIKECGRVVGGATPKSAVDEYWDGDIAWVTPKDIAHLDGKYIGDTPRKITESGLSKCSAELLPPNSVLLSSRAPIGHVAINTIPMATNQGFKSIVPGSNVDSGFLYWWLRSNTQKLQSLGNGATFKEISKSVVERLEVPVPPLDEQKRFAAILDKADALRRLRKQAIDRLNTLSQSIFHEMFGNAGDGNGAWPKATIRDLLAEAKYGTSKKANTDGRGLPVLRMGNVTYDGRLDLTDLKHVELTENELPKYTTRPGDILFNRTNSKELVGKTAVVDRDEPMALAGYLVRARVNERANPHFVSGYLNSPHGKAVLRGMCKNIVGMANINAQEFQDIPIGVPPKELQDEFEHRLGRIGHHRHILNRSTASLGSLFASLQHRAFAGEL